MERRTELYLQNGDFEKARIVFENLIKVNPPDNQGARWELIGIYLAQKDYEAILALDKRYPNEYSAFMAVSILLALIKLGRIKEAEKRIKNVIKNHAITLEYLIDGKPEDLGFEPSYFVPFGRSEGYFYFHYYYKYWDQDAIKFIKKYEKEIRKRANELREELRDEIESLNKLEKLTY